MDDDIAGNCDASSANNGEESELQFRELGRKLCEEIEEMTTALAEGRKNDGFFSSNVYLEKLASFDETFCEAQSCQHLMTDAKLTKCISKLALIEVQNVQNDVVDKAIDFNSFVHTLISFLQEQCGLAKADDEVEATNQQKSWATFGDRFINDILRLPPALSSIGPPPIIPQEVVVEIKKKTERTRAKKNEEIVKLDEVEEEELARRMDPLAKQLDNVMHCLKRTLKQRGTTSINYFEFCFHPTDFSRTVANAFYTSFLVKENKVALGVGDDNMPLLSLLRSEERAELVESNVHENRGVISFSYEDWEKAVKLLNITSPVITSS